MAGVIPIIFAISIVLFPTMIAQFFVQAQTQWLANFANWIIVVMQNQLIYGIIYFVLVFAFTYFYTAIVMDPNQLADNMKKHGGFIPGVRPGKRPAQYIDRIMTRITLPGSIALAAVAIFPFFGSQQFNVTGAFSRFFGVTWLLFVVGVGMDTCQ